MRKGRFVLATVLLTIAFVLVCQTMAPAQTAQEELMQQMEEEPISAFTTLHYTWAHTCINQSYLLSEIS